MTAYAGIHLLDSWLCFHPNFSAIHPSSLLFRNPALVAVARFLYVQTQKR